MTVQTAQRKSARVKFAAVMGLAPSNTPAWKRSAVQVVEAAQGKPRGCNQTTTQHTHPHTHTTHTHTHHTLTHIHTQHTRTHTTHIHTQAAKERDLDAGVEVAVLADNVSVEDKSLLPHP